MHAELTDEHLQPLQPYTTRLLTTLLDAQVFHILPESSLHAQNPSVLPREIFVPDGVDPSSLFGTASEASTSGTQKQPKKKGRPSKRDKAKRAKDAVLSLDKWLEKNSFSYPTFVGTSEGPGLSLAEDAMNTTHALIAHRPITQQQNYNAQKNNLLALLDLLGSQDGPSSSGNSIMDQHHHPGKAALSKVNEAILTRLKKIDEMAAEQGLEVGGEGGEMTGLSRVEKAVADFRAGKSRGGILELLEGAGIETGPQVDGLHDVVMQG